MFESFKCSTQNPPRDDPFNKPLEVKTLDFKKSEGLDLGDYVGCTSETKRNDGKTDIILTFKGESFKAHKHVMRRHSEFFSEEPAFQPRPTTSKKKRRPNQSKFDLNAAKILPAQITASMVDQAINFAYTGLMPLFPDKNFLDFLAVAIAFQYTTALNVSKKHLQALYGHEHRPVPTWMVANIMSQSRNHCTANVFSTCGEELEHLFNDACTYLFLNLKVSVRQLKDDVEFLTHLCSHAVEDFLERDDLAKEVEELEVLNFALAWLKCNAIYRRQFSGNLLQHIHLGVLSRDRLVALLTDNAATDDVSKEMVKEVLTLMDSKDEVTIPLEISDPDMFAERGKLPVKTLVGIGPGFGGCQRLLYFNAYEDYFDTPKGWQDWCDFHPIPDPAFPIYDASVLEVNGKLYVAGGCDNTYRKHYSDVDNPSRSAWPAPCSGKWTTNSFYEGNIGVNILKCEDTKEAMTLNITNPWSMLMPMKNRRRMFPMVHLNGFLYAIGGQDDTNKAMKEVERYSFQHKKWHQLADMPVPCYYACATTYKGKILVYGSQPVPNEDTPAQHNLQMYDPATNKWTNLLTEHYKITKFMMIDAVSDSDAKSGAKEDETTGLKVKEEETKGQKVKEETKGPKVKEEETKRPKVKEEETKGPKVKEEETKGPKVKEETKGPKVKEETKGPKVKEEHQAKASASCQCEDCQCHDDDDWSDCDSDGVSINDRMKENREIGCVQPRNALVVDGGNCYRLLYKAVKISPKSIMCNVQPVVNRLELNLNGGKPSARVGKKQDQKLIQLNGDGAFNVNNNIYINMKGCVHNTGIKITPGQKKKVNTGVWKKLPDRGPVFEDLTVANFSFDKKAAFCQKCVEGESCTDDSPLFPSASGNEESTRAMFDRYQRYKAYMDENQ